jgi:hypothetical protein
MKDILVQDRQWDVSYAVTTSWTEGISGTQCSLDQSVVCMGRKEVSDARFGSIIRLRKKH